MPANAAPARLTGAIEGFYGRPWAPAERLQLVSDLAELGLDAYLYAPKADAHLEISPTSEQWSVRKKLVSDTVAPPRAQSSCAANLASNEIENRTRNRKSLCAK